MSHAIDELRKHFNRKAVPNSKTLKDERDKVNALIDAVEEENDKLRELISDMLFDEDLGHNDDNTFFEHNNRASELGIKF